MAAKLNKALRFATNRLGVTGQIGLTLGQIVDNATSQLDKLQIILNKDLAQDLMIETLFHEIAHFQQFQTGKLAWDGSYWVHNGKVQFGNYWFQSHEVEARQIARELMLEWNRATRNPFLEKQIQFTR